MTITRTAELAREDAAAMARRAKDSERHGDIQAAHYWWNLAQQARADADRLEKTDHADRR